MGIRAVSICSRSTLRYAWRILGRPKSLSLRTEQGGHVGRIRGPLRRSRATARAYTFACVVLNSIHMLGVDSGKLNVNGGAVALGHPLGASGARILGALVLELGRRGGGLGCAAICSGGGQGDAVIVEVNGR